VSDWEALGVCVSAVLLEGPMEEDALSVPLPHSEEVRVPRGDTEAVRVMEGEAELLEQRLPVEDTVRDPDPVALLEPELVCDAQPLPL
jgi:hypothetical protein